MSTGVVVLMTDHGSGEGSRIPLEKAVELLTGAPPLSVDARHFMADGGGRVGLDRNGFEMEVASEGFAVSPEVLIVYEIPPAEPWAVDGLPAATVTRRTVVFRRGPGCLAQCHRQTAHR
jgi:hypothetical protein